MLYRLCPTAALLVAAIFLYATAFGQEACAEAGVSHELGAPFYTGAIMPTPREAAYRDEYVALLDGPAGVRCYDIRIDGFGPARELAERLILSAFGRYDALYPGIEDAPAAAPCVPVAVALASSDAAKPYVSRYGLGERVATLGAQGYVLEIRPHAVLCLGMDNAGVVNAVASLLQLTHVRDGKLVARCASVCDWPAFTTRYTAEYFLPGPDFFDWMMLNKINGFAACYPGMNWHEMPQAKWDGLKVIGDYIEQYQTMQFMAEFHVGGRRGPLLDCGNPAHVSRLLETIHRTIELSHARHIMICYDDVRPELQPEEQKRFKSTVEAHGHLMQQVYDAVKGQSPETIVCFCTPYYQGRHHRRWRDGESRGKGLAYLNGIGAWPCKDVRIVWTGPVTESRVITVEDIEDYLGRLGIEGPLFYWDNTWHYHQPLRNFHARYPNGFVDHCADRTSYINVNGVRPIGRFFAVTANDYYWNPEAFDPKRARRQAVAQFMGPPAVPAAEGLYDVRGEDYFVFFSARVDLPAFKQAIADLEDASLEPALPEHCWAAYNGVVDKRCADKGPPPAAAQRRTAPLIRGTLWWIVYDTYAQWTKAQFTQAIEAQRAVGFDVLWILNTPTLLRKAEEGPVDLMETIYAVADEKDMHVIADLPKGGWHGKTTAEEMIATLSDYAASFHARYGAHKSFYGWYLNHEINPIAPDDAEQSGYWRQAWRGVADACHEVAPGSVVTISPFFLLDEPRRRGFVYLTPGQYADWWGKTLEETGIDILMLQDSGEHLSFFTLEQREPFFAAVADACHQAGAQFWVNVETGEAHVANWDEFLELSKQGKVPWRFTPIDRLAKKLRLAARYSDSIINWGYFPYMNPTPPAGKEMDGQQQAYAAYKAYYERMTAAGVKRPPLAQ